MPKIRRIFRAYFNRKREAPQVWSIDEGSQDSEVNIVGFVVHPGCEIHSRYNGTKANEDSPSAWMDIHADHYYINAGVAHFATLPADGRP